MTIPVDLDRLDVLIAEHKCNDGCFDYCTRDYAIVDAYEPMAAEIRALRAEVERLRAVRDAAVALLKFASRWEDGESHHYYCGIACAGGECDCGGNALRAALDAAAGGV